MSVNSSSSFNSSLPPSPSSSSVILYSVLQNCLNSTVGFFSITAILITSILFLLPLYVSVIYVGLQRWRQQGSNMTTSHSDLLTYHMIIIELICVVGYTLVWWGVLTALPQMTAVGTFLFVINLSGQALFHILTCVERYLAVVHPVTYLSLKRARGIRMRNITIGCVWVVCTAQTSVMKLEGDVSITIFFFCAISVPLAVMSFCSLSVLWVLIRRGPGERGKDRGLVDQSKLRAFYTIMAILGVLGFRFGGNIVASALHASLHVGEDGRCALLLSVSWLSVPSSLVLPLLFLHRAGKLLCCKTNK